jgi:hypothetical protein
MNEEVKKLCDLALTQRDLGRLDSAIVTILDAINLLNIGRAESKPTPKPLTLNDLFVQVCGASVERGPQHVLDKDPCYLRDFEIRRRQK